jgi:hypothetical protein
MTIPSERVKDTFRSRNYGKVQVPTNSKPATDSFHVDRSRLGVHDEYDPEAPNDWGGKGKYVPVQNSIMDNVRGAMGGIGARSSFKSVHEPADPTKTEGPAPCCYEGPRPDSNPLMKRKGD